MKAGMIFARKATWRSRLDLEYLDETSARKASSRQQHNDGPKTPLRQFADYASKETLGQVHAGGFLHHLTLINEDGSRTAPSQMTNEERQRRISEAWFEHIRKYPTSSKNPSFSIVLFSPCRARCTTSWSMRNQSRPRVAVHDEEDHGQVQRAVSSGGLDWLRLRDSSRHGQSSHPCRALPAHGAGRVCRVQYGPESRVRPQGPDEVPPLVLRAGERTVGAGSRLSAKDAGKPFQAARFRHDRVFPAPESLPDGRLAERPDGGSDPAPTTLFPASAISKRQSREAKSFRAEAERELYLADGWTARAESRARCRKIMPTL